MQWYYAADGKQAGPVDEGEWDALVRSGAISGSTLVWREGMAEWRPYREVAPAPEVAIEAPAVPESLGADMGVCIECGKAFPREDMVHYSGAWVCAVCKPVFFQRVQEGVALPNQLEYAGFWIRVGASLIDWVILMLVDSVLSLAFGMNPFGGAQLFGFLSLGLQSLVSMSLRISYETWFIGKFGATPGKMACGLRVVRPDGSGVSYWRAFGRYWGKFLSGLILCIGYLMVAFDDERRGLHDRLCDTRVIRQRRG